MSSIEERLARDIADVTGGVVVTESDLWNARNALNERIDSRKRGRRRTLAAAAAAVVIPILGVAAFRALGPKESAPPANTVPASPNAHDPFLTGRAPTPELLRGVWRVDDDTVLMRFSPPNAISFDTAGRLFDDPGVQGTYEIAGNLITISVDGGPAGCAGQTFAMRASLPEPGALRFVHTQPGTGNCAPVMHEQWELEQVLPTSQSLAELDFSSGSGWQPLAGKTALWGVWLAEGGGHILELDGGGTYYVADESGEPIDRGRWSLRGSDLTLASSADSVTCSEGDRLVLGAVKQINPGTPAIRGTVRQNTCEAAWAQAVWILLPNEYR